MRAIRILIAVGATSALLVAQSPTSTSSSPTTGSRATQSTTAPVTASRSTATSRVMLPAGTAIEVRVNESLSSETTQQGEKFTGTVTSDVTDPNTNRVIIPRGADITGHVISATPSGRLSSSGELQLALNTIRYGTAAANVSVEPYVIKGESHTKSNTTKVGGGAALGAIIGAIAGGGKGAVIGAGVGGAAGAGTAAATGKRPAEVQPEALVKFITSGDTSVTAADQSGYSSTSPGASQSTTWPEPARPGSASTTQSTAAASSPSTDTSADPTANSDTSDAPPIMHRRDGSTAPTPPASTGNSTGTPAAPSSNTTTTASNTTYGTSNPPPSNGTVYGSTTAPSSSASSSTSTTGTTTTATTPTAPSSTTTTTTSTTSSLPDNRLFSARDRRVVNQCLKDNATALPPAYMHKSATAPAYQRGQVVPTDIQRQLRSLPLSCDNQLPPVSNDLERVIYGGQVMLIDSGNRVLDVFDVNQ